MLLSGRGYATLLVVLALEGCWSIFNGSVSLTLLSFLTAKHPFANQVNMALHVSGPSDLC